MARKIGGFEQELAGFLKSEPLYRKARLNLPNFERDFRAEVLLLECETCRTERPFRNSKVAQPSLPLFSGGRTLSPPPVTSGIRTMHFKCTGCDDGGYYFFLYVNAKEGWVRKIGQNPPWSTEIPRGVADLLGDDARLYRKAKICLSQSFGLGACGYLRKILEHQVNAILELLRDLRTASGAPESELIEIKEIIDGNLLTDKTDYAYKHAPHSIIVEGYNPLKLIHDFPGDAIHKLTEDQAIRRASQVIAAVEFVVREFQREKRSKGEFLAAIKNLKPGPKSG